MTTGLPTQTQVIELLGEEFARAGYEIEDVVIDPRARPPRITVIADGDTALDLDTIATLSRSASTLLDGLEGIERLCPRGEFARRGTPADQSRSISAAPVAARSSWRWRTDRG